MIRLAILSHARFQARARPNLSAEMEVITDQWIARQCLRMVRDPKREDNVHQMNGFAELYI